MDASIPQYHPVILITLLLTVSHIPCVSLLTTTLTTSSDHCRFPNTMYLHPSKQHRDDHRLKWYIYSANPTWSIPHDKQMVDFDEDRILVHHGHSDPKLDADVTYACIEQLDDWKYLVTKQRANMEHMYQCLQFVIRSDTVVQWRLSAESEVHSVLLCDDHSLKLQEAPLVYYSLPGHWDATKTRQRKYIPCPLEGGYFISQWGNSTHDKTCRDNIPPSKLESECGKGDGIRYKTGKVGCSLPFAKATSDQLFCIGAWLHDKFSFAIVVSKDIPHAVSCMRFPTMHGHSFTAHIFTDGVCHMGYAVHDDPLRRSITMSPHIETSLCGDDTQACVMKRNIECTESISQICRETCETCPNPTPWGKVKIARQFHGRWVLFRGGPSHEVGISEKFVEIPTLGKYEVFGMNTCPTTGSDVTSGKKRYVFVTNFENGCSPRLTAMELFKRSDAVISLRISESAPLDYTVSRLTKDNEGYTITGWENWCHGLHFRSGPIEHDDSFRTDPSGWYNLIHKDRTSLPQTCTFPESLQQMRLSLTSGVNCTVEVVQDATNGFSVKLEACQSDGSSDNTDSGPIGSPISVTCLAAFGGRARGTQYFITRTTSDARIGNQKFMCWSLDLDALRGYLLPVSDCDDNSGYQVDSLVQRISYGRMSAVSISLPEIPTTTPVPIPGVTLRGEGSDSINTASPVNTPAVMPLLLLPVLMSL